MQAWLERTGHPRGAVVPLARLWDLAQRWYAGRGDPGWRGRSADEAQAYVAGRVPVVAMLVGPGYMSLIHEIGALMGLSESRVCQLHKRILSNLKRHLYARIEDGKFHGVPVTIIEPSEELSGFSVFSILNSYPGKARRMIAAGYRDAKRALERPEASLPQHKRRAS